MAIAASTISSTQTLEEFRLEYNKLRSDVSTLESNPTYGASITFEGATADAYETTLTVTDPTADRTITLPNITGTVITTGDTGTVSGTMVADNAIDSDHYTDGSIDNAHIADDAIDSEHYAAGSIDTAHIADDQVTLAKMAGLARGKIIYGNSSGNPTALAVGSSDQILTADGTDLSWSDPAAGGAGYFLGGASGATGDTTNGLEDIFRVNSATVDNSCTIASSTNANATGPLTVSSGVTVTVAGVLAII